MWGGGRGGGGGGGGGRGGRKMRLGGWVGATHNP